jgi:dCMP deaminase
MRPNWLDYYLDMAKVVSSRGSCIRRKVGCILVSADWKILSTGYNGTPSGFPNCIDLPKTDIEELIDEIERSEGGEKAISEGRKWVQETFYKNSAPTLPSHYQNACKGRFSPSGTNLDNCKAVHAEQNALIQCPDYRAIRYAFCTVSPCIHCAKMLLNTPCQVIVFSEEYPHSESREMWQSLNRKWLLKGSDQYKNFIEKGLDTKCYNI